MLNDPVFNKLSNVLGPQEAPRLINSVCLKLGLDDLRNPQNRMAFGCALIERGGLLEAIGRSIKIQAILHGASEP